MKTLPGYITKADFCEKYKINKKLFDKTLILKGFLKNEILHTNNIDKLKLEITEKSVNIISMTDNSIILPLCEDSKIGSDTYQYFENYFKKVFNDNRGDLYHIKNVKGSSDKIIYRKKDYSKYASVNQPHPGNKQFRVNKFNFKSDKYKYIYNVLIDGVEFWTARLTGMHKLSYSKDVWNFYCYSEERCAKEVYKIIKNNLLDIKKAYNKNNKNGNKKKSIRHVNFEEWIDNYKKLNKK